MNQYKAIIFDLDGTLLDTIDDLADSMNSVLARLECPTHPRDSYKYFVGNGVEVLARRVLPDDRQDTESIKQCVNEMLFEYNKRWTIKTRPYQGIDRMLDSLLEQELKLNVLSNKPESLTREAVEYFLGEWPFTIVAGARSDIPKKPDPAGALKIAAALGLKPEQFLYLGDTNTDMQTAISAGMFPIGALWGFRTASELEEAGARLMIKHPSEMLDHL